ncbi:hypothetical protein [Actinoplanes sp. NBRC 101535]|uniref:hypothetical protein n=1 Tax=Actinoplanes sp. NBRC 101535 TaxID=3032196 RepID=UPI0024A2F9AB|nr:hypothetical protein [Actinoplanes sp. NBRC 101535]GLY08304.1 hypothetical protein Acsp01_86830 [Actinoplanes sp. NBRC 101535]
MSDVRFGIKVFSDNGHHVHFRLFAATGGQHLGGSGQLTMTTTEYARFRELLAPALTDRPDPAPAANPVMGVCGEDGRCRSCMALDVHGSGCGSTYPQAVTF